MVEKTAEDYAKIFQSIDPANEINPICMNIEDMLARLDEFETLLASVKAETNGIIENHISNIVNFSDNFAVLRERIDKLERFVEVVNANVNQVENTLDIAEEELNVTDYSLKGLLLKPLLAKTKADTTSTTIRSNLKDEEFHAVPIFKADAYFGEGSMDSTEEAKECSSNKC